jgi:hypothetical protein
MKFAPKVGDLIYIRWRDHCTVRDVAWRRLDEIDDAEIYCETVGFVAVITREAITVVGSVTSEDGTDTLGSVICIRLRNCITHGKIIKRFK